MLRDVAGHLRCPHCEGELALAASALACRSGHAFDIARQGYVNLLAGGAGSGTADTPEMVDAREAFLTSGHLSPLAEDLASESRRLAASMPAGGTVVDVGAGTGYYLAAALAALPGRSGIALDISKHAARRAARAHPRIGAVVCDAWGALPVRSGRAAIVLSAFSPRNGEQMRRILRPDGALLLVTPTREHLSELVSPLGLLAVDARKDERVAEQLGAHFQLECRSARAISLRLSHADVERLVRMGPSARHIDPATAARRVAALPAQTTATASLKVSVYRPR